MATAVAGGAAVKILQYFEQGYYPWGDNSRSDREQFAPSSSLVKALMMSAAVPMETANGNQRQFYFGLFSASLPPSPPPQITDHTPSPPFSLFFFFF